MPLQVTKWIARVVGDRGPVGHPGEQRPCADDSRSPPSADHAPPADRATRRHRVRVSGLAAAPEPRVPTATARTLDLVVHFGLWPTADRRPGDGQGGTGWRKERGVEGRR
jgi:hypothetical protein